MSQEAAKQLISSSHDIGYALKIIQHELLIFADSARKLNHIEQQKKTSDSILAELSIVQGMVEDSLGICNELYHFGLNAQKGGEL